MLAFGSLQAIYMIYKRFPPKRPRSNNFVLCGIVLFLPPLTMDNQCPNKEILIMARSAHYET